MAAVLSLAIAFSSLDPSASVAGVAGVAVLAALFTVVGLLIAYRQPRNAMGWLMYVAALAFVVNTAASEYCILVYRQHRLWHAIGPVAVVLQPMWAPAILLIVLLVLLFPDARMPLGRWRAGLWTLLAGGGLWMLGAFGIAGDAIATGRVRITSSGDLTVVDHPTGGFAWWGVLQSAFFVALFITLVLSVARQVVAFRRATGERRLQLKWLMWGVVVFAVLTPLNFLNAEPSGWSQLLRFVGLLALTMLPTCMGVAILKYRLFDIDRVISRTLSYAVVTATLVGGYIGAVTFTTRVLPFSSPVGVVTCTLAAAALFNPLRRTVQRSIDRRFNRGRYDAAATVAAFAERLRDTVSLSDVRADLMTVVEGALSPQTAFLWLPK